MRSDTPPLTVSYCHCADCRRVTGAPVAAFAAFNTGDITFLPNAGKVVEVNPGIKRTFCSSCGSPISGIYDYLPGKVYISIGLLDQADQFPPQLHGHTASRLSWLRFDDDIACHSGSARSDL